MPNINFQPIDKYYNYLEKPNPSIKYIPEWYKNMSNKVIESGRTLFFLPGSSRINRNQTVKSCTPFLDAFQTGYTISLPCDVEFVKEENGDISYNWRADNITPIGTHSNSQYSSDAKAQGTFPYIFKWEVKWKITTPKGYSCLFVHPLNQYHLPFMTLSGVVDTDEYPIAPNFPFQLIDFKGDSLIIKAGTPIVQIIPIKRENWTSSKGEFNQEEVEKDRFELQKTIKNSYRKKWWHKKSYS
jgi:hypothetical protein